VKYKTCSAYKRKQEAVRMWAKMEEMTITKEDKKRASVYAAGGNGTGQRASLIARSSAKISQSPASKAAVPGQMGSLEPKSGSQEPKTGATASRSLEPKKKGTITVMGFLQGRDPEMMEACGQQVTDAPIDLWDGVVELLAPYLDTQLKPGFIESSHFKTYVRLVDYAKKEVSLEDFTVFRILGRGAFGAVNAVQKKDTNQMFAAKTMSKKIVKHNRGEKLVMKEREILGETSSPFVLNLNYAFCGKDHFYLIFRMLGGGDLNYHLNNCEEGCFSAVRTRFHAAEVLLGLEHLHSMNIVYRDLKPANILLDDDGHCVISDLGLALHIDPNKIRGSYGGTPGYMPPEIMDRSGCYFTSDWWTYGVFIYELLTGIKPDKCECKEKEWCPFDFFKHEKHCQDDGMTCKAVADYPKDTFGTDPDVVDFLKQIFDVDPCTRIGSKNGAQDLKDHPYFKSLDWDKVITQEVEVPFKPSKEVHAESLGDTGNFDEDKYKKVKLDEKDEKMYEEFPFVKEKALEKDLCKVLAILRDWEGDDKKKKDNAGGGCCVIA